ncbi:MAG: carbohydrate ABC transporter permease [Clostridiales bacterium]|nr:carbohydrate ABC transporter permease [Clostridiales bacterium]
MFYAINTLLLLITFLIVAYPIYFVIIASVSNPLAVNSGQVILAPVGFTLNGYEKILAFSRIWLGYRNTIFYVILGTAIAVVLTVSLAYPLSRKDFRMRNPLMAMVAFTMIFGGGMIPTYLVINQMNLLNTIWAVVLPGAITAQHVIIVRTFFQSIPSEMVEAAAIDGATNFKVFLKIILPLSKAVVAVIVLYVASSLWNGYFGPMIYLTDQNLYPLQLFLRQILLQNDMQGVDISAAAVAEQQETAQLIKYGVIIVSTVPMMILYPFVQKYFVKGVMIGSIKG